MQEKAENNKKTQLLLLLLLVFVWGAVAIRFSKLRSGQSEARVPGSSPTQRSNPAEISGDTLVLLLNYPDPFGFHRNSLPTTQEKPDYALPQRPALTDSPGSKPLPSLIYKGFSKGADNQLRALIAINGRNCVLLPGQSKDQVKLMSVTQDSVLIMVNNKTIALKRKK